MPQDIYEIKVTLLGSKPPIWRRLLVPVDLTLARLHDVLQAAMGWENYHLHEFLIGGDRYGVPDPEDTVMGLSPTISERRVRLSGVLHERGAKAVYTYDFGDGWDHAIVVEKIVNREAGVSYPVCTAGKLHGPPEDCGGIGGFYNFLEAIGDPNHEEHEELLEWIGGNFDPKQFSPEAVNERLRAKFRPVRKTGAKRTKPQPKEN